MSLDWRKPHTIHGAGPGLDVVIQNNKLYDRAGRPLPPELQVIADKQIPVTNELQIHLKTQQAERHVSAQRRELDDYVARIRREAEERLKQGLSVEPEDEEEVSDDGLADLEAALASQATTSRVRK